jgi:outer membrane receptor protein involved in Fe transport
MTLCVVLLSSSAVRAEREGDAPALTTESAIPGGTAMGVPGPTEGQSPAENPGASPAAENGLTPEEDESRAASQVASFAVTPLKNSPAVVTVITGEDIRNAGARDLIDILSMVPGYFTGVDTLGVVGPGFRGLWGHEGKILLIIDGKEMNELLFSSMQLGNEFPVELIERVEVVRGPGSVIYGGSAELSVINVITRGLQGSTDATATATYGEYPGARAVSSGYGRRKITVSGRYVVETVPGLSTFASASFGEGQRSVRSFVDNAGASATLEGQSALDPTVIHLGVGYKDVQASFLYQRLAMTTVSGFGTVAPLGPLTFDGFHGELVGTYRPIDRVEIVPRFNITYQTPWRAPADRGDPEAYYDKAVRRLRGRLLGRWAALDQLQVTAGGDAIFDEARLLSPEGAGLQIPFAATGTDQISYQTFAGFVELFSENPIVNVSAGARYEHKSSVGGSLVPRLVLLRNFGSVSLKGLFSLSFRTPGIENLNVGNTIRSEQTRVFEFEGAVDLTPQQRVSANVFDLAIDSPIAYSVDPATSMETYLNLGRQGTRGFEVAYQLRHPLARVEANYSFYIPSVAENTPSYNVPGHSEQFLAAPAQRGYIRANLRPWEGFGVTPSAVIYGHRYAKGAPIAGVATAVEVPAQILANLFIYRDNVGITGLRVGLGIYNLFGTNYSFVHAAATTPANSSAAAAQDAFSTDHAPLPGLDREIMLQIAYLIQPS